LPKTSDVGALSGIRGISNATYPFGGSRKFLVLEFLSPSYIIVTSYSGLSAI